MSRARGRRPVSSQQQGRAITGVRLAPGISLEGGKSDKAKDAVMVLLSPNGPVQLNRTAAAILQLCDGSRDREGVVAEVMRRSNPHTRAAEIIEFLDAARARGWIDET
jgi:pyrroloquinoline quinone biosynthesis protein D